MQIKVCGMKYKDNIRELIALHPDFIGFMFYMHSSRYIGERIDPEILERVPATTLKTGVFVNAPETHIKKTGRTHQLDVIQLHGQESPEYCKAIREEGFYVIKVFQIQNPKDFDPLQAYQSVCDYFLFDTASQRYYGGTGQKFNWDILSSYNLDTPFFLSGGIHPEDAPKINQIQHNAFQGIDINSGFEIHPGLKDISKIQSLIRQLNTDD